MGCEDAISGHAAPAAIPASNFSTISRRVTFWLIVSSALRTTNPAMDPTERRCYHSLRPPTIAFLPTDHSLSLTSLLPLVRIRFHHPRRSDAFEKQISLRCSRSRLGRVRRLGVQAPGGDRPKSRAAGGRTPTKRCQFLRTQTCVRVEIPESSSGHCAQDASHSIEIRCLQRVQLRLVRQ